MAFQKVKGLAQAGQHAKGKNVDLQNAEGFKIILVPLDLGTVFHGRIHDRDDGVEPVPGDDKAAHMLGQMAGKAVDFGGQFQHLARR